MSVSSKQQKSIDKEIVLGMAEALMILNGETSTLQVKAELRKQGYFATQAAVSHFMDVLSEEEGWVYEFNGKFRVYAFQKDTDEIMYEYLEKDGYFWELLVNETDQIIFYGKTGSMGDLSRLTFDTNRHAILNGRNLIDRKLEDGFEAVEDVRELSIELRLKYFAYLKKQVKEVTLSYFGTHKTEVGIVEAELTSKSGNITKKLTMEVEKNAGYELHFEQPQGIAQLLRRPSWDALKTGFDDCFLLGEKVVKRQFWEEEMLIDQVSSYQVLEPAQTTAIEVNNDRLYRIDLNFEDGAVLSLSKYEMELKSELIPLAQLLLAD